MNRLTVLSEAAVNSAAVAAAIAVVKRLTEAGAFDELEAISHLSDAELLMLGEQELRATTQAGTADLLPLRGKGRRLQAVGIAEPIQPERTSA